MKPKSNHTVKICAALVVPLVFWLGRGAAYAAAGTSGASFLDIPVGAGPAALGSAYSALAADAYAPVWNPAGLGFVDSTQIAGQHLSYLESINYEFLSVVHPLRKGDSLGFSAQYLGSGDINGLDQGGNPTGTYSDTFGAYSLAYGHAFNDRLSLGLTGKLIHIRLDDVSANAYGADFGSLYKVNDQINLAAVLANVGSKLTFINDGDSLPLTFRWGGSYQPTVHWLATAEAVIPKSGPAGVRMGGEWKPLEMVGIRAGYRTDTTKELSALAGFSTGIGIHLWGQEFAYAWVPYGDLGDTQYFSILLRFGAEAEKKRNLIQYQNIKKSRSVNEKPGSLSEPEERQLMQLLNQGETKEKVGQTPQKPGDVK